MPALWPAALLHVLAGLVSNGFPLSALGKQ